MKDWNYSFICHGIKLCSKHLPHYLIVNPRVIINHLAKLSYYRLHIFLQSQTNLAFCWSEKTKCWLCLKNQWPRARRLCVAHNQTRLWYSKKSHWLNTWLSSLCLCHRQSWLRRPHGLLSSWQAEPSFTVSFLARLMLLVAFHWFYIIYFPGPHCHVHDFYASLDSNAVISISKN